MRLSTSMLYELGMRGVQRPQAEQLELQQKISANRRILKPSDDPIASATIISLNQAVSVNTQYAANAQNAQATLALEADALGDVTRVLQDMKALVVKAGNPVLQNQDRASIGTEVRVLYAELIGIANRTDGTDQYLFSGYQGSTRPFAETAPGVVAFSGDEGQRLAQIGPQRRVAVGDSGAEVFQRAREGNGTFVTSPAATNTGTGVSGEGTIRNVQAWDNPGNSRAYTVRFYVDSALPPVTTYDVVDTATGTSMLTGTAATAGPYARTFNSGNTIDMQRQATDPVATAFDAGIQLSITGAPATGDTFVVRRAANKDVFSTAHDLITSLSTALPTGPAARALYDSALSATSSSLGRAMDHVLTTRASAGVRLRELDTARDTASDLGLRYAEDLSRLQDLDYASALSELAQKQFSLEAAQKSYVAVTQLKLFDFI